MTVGKTSKTEVRIDYLGRRNGVDFYTWQDNTNGNRPLELRRDEITTKLKGDYRRASLRFGPNVIDAAASHFKRAAYS